MEALKRILFIGDGMADRPLEALGGATALNSLRLPGLARLAGEAGMVRVVPPGNLGGTVQAVPLILGWDPLELGGRGAVEAAGLGLDLEEGQWVMRCNLCSLREGVMACHNGGLTEQEGQLFFQALAEDGQLQAILEAEGLRLREGRRFRHFLSGTKPIEDLPGPHEILDRSAAPWLRGHPLAKALDWASHVLRGHPLNRGRKDPVNALWPWGLAWPRRPQSFYDRRGLRGLCVSAVPAVQGIGRLLSMKTPQLSGVTGDLDTCWMAKVQALDRWEWDFALVHLEAPDERSHQRDLPGKIAALKLADAMAAELVRRFPEARILAMADHGTSAATGAHLDDPVPYGLWQGRPGAGDRWGERDLAPLELAELQRRFFG